MNETIKSQLMSAGFIIRDDVPLYKNVINFMSWSNRTDYIPDSLKNVSSCSYELVNISEIYKNRYRKVDSHEIPDGGFAGVLLDRWLLDGYHRYEWMKEQGIDKGYYIVLHEG